MPLGVGSRFARYTIVRLLGSGGMGEVYLAKHPRLPRHDALKVLPASISADSSFRERFHREADLAATLFHPHIVGVHDKGEHDGQLWIAMDFIDGTDAAHALDTRYPAGMPAAEVAEIVSAVASALDHAHKRALLHRDVKPANIMLARPEDDDEDRRIMLADFGIARPIDDLGGLTTTNMTVGTVAYAAPEQLMGKQLDGRADQYALAATAYHLVSGSQPFPHTNPAVVIGHHLTSAPPSLAGIRPDLAALDPVFATALAKDPAERFTRCGDFARAFDEQVKSFGGSASFATTARAPVAGRPLAKAATKSTTGGPPAVKPSADASKPSGSRERRALSIPLIPAVIAILIVASAIVAVTWRPWERSSQPVAQPSPTSSAPKASPTSMPPATAAPPVPPLSPPLSANPVASPPQGQAVDPAATGPAEGSSCNHAQFNNTTVSNSGSVVRCISVPDGFGWEPDAGEQADPRLVGQPGWNGCLRESPQDQCVRSAVAVAGGIYPAGPVYPPGTYAVPGSMPYGTYGSSIDGGTGQFSNGVAANPCTYGAYDAAGNVLSNGTFNSYSQSQPQAQLDRRTTLFRTSGCTPWALTRTE